MSDDAKLRFRDYVDLNLTASKLLSTEQERSLIGDGIEKFKLPGDAARGVVAVAADHVSRIREREVSRSMLAIMREIAGKRRSIDKKRFALGVAILKALTDGELTDLQARAWLKRLILQGDFRIRGSGLLRRTRWFRKIKTVV